MRSGWALGLGAHGAYGTPWRHSVAFKGLCKGQLTYHDCVRVLCPTSYGMYVHMMPHIVEGSHAPLGTPAGPFGAMEREGLLN